MRDIGEELRQKPLVGRRVKTGHERSASVGLILDKVGHLADPRSACGIYAQ